MLVPVESEVMTSLVGLLQVASLPSRVSHGPAVLVAVEHAAVGAVVLSVSVVFLLAVESLLATWSLKLEQGHPTETHLRPAEIVKIF